MDIGYLCDTMPIVFLDVHGIPLLYICTPIAFIGTYVEADIRQIDIYIFQPSSFGSDFGSAGSRSHGWPKSWLS
jgi:hypothetical protein